MQGHNRPNTDRRVWWVVGGLFLLFVMLYTTRSSPPPLPDSAPQRLGQPEPDTVLSTATCQSKPVRAVTAKCDPTLANDCLNSCPVCELRAVGGNPETGYGAWHVCVNMLPTTRPPIVASFGIGSDITFDRDMVKKHGATVYGFDPTVDENFVERMRGPAQLTADELRFWPWGLSNEDTTVVFSKSTDPRIGSQSHFSGVSDKQYTPTGVSAQVKTLHTVMAAVGVRYWDVLKMDVEGAEFDVFLEDPDLMLDVPADQILVEFHSRISGDPDRFKRRRKTALAMLRRHGFEVVLEEQVDVVLARVCPRARA